MNNLNDRINIVKISQQFKNFISYELKIQESKGQ